VDAAKTFCENLTAFPAKTWHAACFFRWCYLAHLTGYDVSSEIAHVPVLRTRCALTGNLHTPSWLEVHLQSCSVGWVGWLVCWVLSFSKQVAALLSSLTVLPESVLYGAWQSGPRFSLGLRSNSVAVTCSDFTWCTI